MRLRWCLGLTVALNALIAGSASAGIDMSCLRWTGYPKADSPTWLARDVHNVYCSQLRLRDQLDNPAYAYLAATEGGPQYLAQAQEQLADGPGHIHGGVTTMIPGAQTADPFRQLQRWAQLAGGRYIRVTFRAADGAQLHGHVFLPPAPRSGKPDGPYPGVVITDGSVQGYEQLYYWAAEGLAQAGYEVMTYDVQGQGDSDLLPAGCSPTSCPGVPYQQNYNFYQGAEDSLSYFDSPANPFYAKLDRGEIGIAGHSLGAAAVSEVGQCDTRVRTIVAWDNLSAISSCTGGGETIPARYESSHPGQVRVPAMSLTNDYLFTPQPMATPPSPYAKTAGYDQVKAAGLDSMIVAFRGATHLTYTYIPDTLPSGELSERFAFYYTLAWFDLHLKHDPSGFRRLIATRFNRSADRYSIGAGTYSPASALADPGDPTAGNLPYAIKGIAVRDATSFYYESEYALDNPLTGASSNCSDMRAGCPAKPPVTP